MCFWDWKTRDLETQYSHHGGEFRFETQIYWLLYFLHYEMKHNVIKHIIYIYRNMPVVIVFALYLWYKVVLYPKYLTFEILNQKVCVYGGGSVNLRGVNALRSFQNVSWRGCSAIGFHEMRTSMQLFF